MFAMPPSLLAAPFARLPDALRRDGAPSDWFFGKRGGGCMGSFLEGLAAEPDGALLVADIPFGRIFRVSPDGAFALIAEYDGEPNGLARAADGTVWIADHRNGLMRLEPATGEVAPVLRRLRREGFKGLNDLLLAPDGTLYLTDQGQTGMQDPTGRVHARRVDGHVDLLVGTLPSPNGLALCPEGRSLYVAVTRANQVWRVPLHADGHTSKVGVFLNLSGGQVGPDGLTTDAAGNLFVCHSGLGCVWMVDPWGVPLLRIDVPGPLEAGLEVTSVCVGADGTLFVTESVRGEILSVTRPAIEAARGPGLAGLRAPA